MDGFKFINYLFVPGLLYTFTIGIETTHIEVDINPRLIFFFILTKIFKPFDVGNHIHFFQSLKVKG